MLAQTTFISFFETSFDHSKMFSLNQKVPIPLTRILTQSLSLHPSRSYPFSSTTLFWSYPSLTEILPRSLSSHLSSRFRNTQYIYQNTPTININIHVARKANKASIAKILRKLYSENTCLHSLFIVTEVLVIILHKNPHPCKDI